LIRGARTLHARGVSHEGTRWFLWFDPPEHNILCSRENESCCIAVCCFGLGLNLPKKSKKRLSNRVGVKSTCLVLASTQTFYSSRSDSYNETQDPTGGLG
jgi:hypothetical protein